MLTRSYVPQGGWRDTWGNTVIYRCITCAHLMILQSPDMVFVRDRGQLMYNAVV